MTPTNIHVHPSAASESSAVSLPRLRSVTNDPAREYAQRPGEVERLPDSIAALILSKQGYSKVGRNGIRVEGITEKPLVFWSETSLTIATKAGTNERILWTLNRLQPDLLHILGKDGEYIESIPLEGKVPWFDEKATQQILGAKRRSQNRIIDRVRALHRPDSEAAAAAATSNDIAMKSIVHTFPISPRDRTCRKLLAERIEPEDRAGSLSTGQRSNLGVNNRGAETVELPSRAEGRARSSARGAFPKAARIHEIQKQLDARRQSHEDRQHVRQQAARFGCVAARAESLSRTITSPTDESAVAEPTEIEEW